MSSMKDVFGAMKNALATGNFTLQGLVQTLQNYAGALEDAEGGGSGGGGNYEIVNSTNISITDNTSVTISVTKKYTNPYVFAVNALPGTSWGGVICVTDLTYNSTADTITFTTFTNGQQSYNNVDWVVVEK